MFVEMVDVFIYTCIVYMITLCTLDKITVTHECGFSMIVQLMKSLLC